MSKRGWCPSLYEPMASGDGLLVRVKPPGGIVTAAAAMQLAEAAQRFGNGIVSNTNRANLQFRGLSEASIHTFADVVLSLGLASTNADVERRRNVIVAPLDAPSAALGHQIEALLAEPAFGKLVGKFGIVVDGGPYSVAAAPGDILLKSGHIIAGGFAASAVDLPDATSRLIAAMLSLGGMRMRDVPAAPLFAAAKLTAVPQAPALTPPAIIGQLPDAFGIGLAFGQTDADGLRTLARLSEAGDGTLRLTPWRTILLPGIAMPATERHDLITDPVSSLLGINACSGQPSCANASVRTQADARILAPFVRDLHVSGCSKGCAHPHPAAITLVGRAGRYDLVRDGGTHDTPERLGLTVAEIADYIRADVLA